MSESNTSQTAGSKQVSSGQVKPCCVCKPEKAARDECMLLNADGNIACKDLIEAHRKCMKGYGFDV